MPLDLPPEPAAEVRPAPPVVHYAEGLAAGRFAIGLAPILAPELTLKLLGFPPEQDNPSARMMARLFGVRDVGLGAIVLASTHEERALCRSFLLNGAMDLSDAAMISIPLIDRAGIDRAAGTSLGFALGGLSAWTVGWFWADCTN